MSAGWISERDAARHDRIRSYLSRGISRRGAARAMGLGLSVVNRLLAGPLETEDVLRIEPCARRKRCAECGGPAVDIAAGRPLCRECMCPEPSNEYMVTERMYYTMRGAGSNLALEMGSVKNDSISLTAFNAKLNAAMKRIGLDPDVPQSLAFGQLAKAGGVR